MLHKSDYGKYGVSGREMRGMPITPITLASTDEPVDPIAARFTLITTNVLGSPNKKEYIYIDVLHTERVAGQPEPPMCESVIGVIGVIGVSVGICSDG